MIDNTIIEGVQKKKGGSVAVVLVADGIKQTLLSCAVLSVGGRCPWRALAVHSKAPHFHVKKKTCIDRKPPQLRTFVNIPDCRMIYGACSAKFQLAEHIGKCNFQCLFRIVAIW